MSRIENHKYSIEEAFRECFYIVPDYQREYVWTDKEILQLLSDINEQFDTAERREYFIGTVLVSAAKDRNHFEVIDGQQRLTTLFMALCALRCKLKGEPISALLATLLSATYTAPSGQIKTTLKLDPRYENASEIVKIVVEAKADPETTRAKAAAAGFAIFGSADNLLNAYRIVHAFLDENYKNQSSLQEYWGYLATNVVFIQISTDVSSALKIFETINERGVGLNSMDLLKNQLFTQVEPQQFTKLKDEWKKITAPLEIANEKPLRFLRYFLMANYKIRNNRSDAVVREDEIYNWLVDKDNAIACGYKNHPFEFVRKIKTNVDKFIHFTQGRANDGQPSQAMDSMQRLCGGAFSLHYVLLLAASSFPPPLFDHLVRQIENFLFYYIFTKTSSKDLERNFSLWADDLRDIGEITNLNLQRTKLNEFIAEKFQKNMTSKDPELTDSLRRYALGSMQQYRTRYLLAKITQFVEMSFRGTSAPGPLREFAELQIEHILPNTPGNDLRSLFAVENPSKDYDEYKARLGNLTLLEKPINVVASNRFFREKRLEYQKSGNYLTRSLIALCEVGKNSSITRINEKLLAFDAWSAADIDRRQDMLIGLARSIWTTSPIDTA